MAEGCGEVSEGLSRLRITEEGVPEGVLEEGQEEGQEAVPRRYSGMADSEGSSSDSMAEGGEGETANVGEESSGESDEEEVCRLCEQSIPRKLLANHLVACTATHSCLEKISKVISSRLAPHYTHTLAPPYTPPPLPSPSKYDESLERVSGRILRRHKRLVAVLRYQQQAIEPLKLMSKYCAEAKAVDLRGSGEPLEQTNRLMDIEKGAARKLSGLSDPMMLELRQEIDRLVGKKLEAHWDLLSLQSPTSSKRIFSGAGVPMWGSGRSRPGTSIREFALVEPIGSGAYGTVWLAKRKRTEDLVAIKVHAKSDTKSKKLLEIVFTEKSILGAIHAPLPTAPATPPHPLLRAPLP